MSESTKKAEDKSLRELASDVIKKARKTTATKRTDPPPTPQPKREEKKE